MPDEKDWTWVVVERCRDCGLNAREVDPRDVADFTAEHVQRWRGVLTRPNVASRPSPDTWSGLEYACHVRDAYGVFTARIALMMARDDPAFADWDQDAAAEAGRYGSQLPADVIGELETAAASYVRALRGVPADGWERPGLRSNGAQFTTATLVRYFLHDVIHHLHDVGG